MTDQIDLIVDCVSAEVFTFLRRCHISRSKGRAGDYQEVRACAPGLLLVCNTFKCVQAPMSCVAWPTDSPVLCDRAAAHRTFALFRPPGDAVACSLGPNTVASAQSVL